MLITDVSARHIASTDQSRIGARSQEAEFILRTGHSATIDHEKTAGYGQSLSAVITFACLLSYNDESFGSLVCIGERETAMSLSAQVKSALETAAAYHDYSQAMLTKTDDRAWLARALLEESMNEPRIRATMNRIEMDASLMRAVICVSMQHHQPSYFNINLNLGYQSSVERINERSSEDRQSRFMNTQDLTLVYDRNTLVISPSCWAA